MSATAADSSAIDFFISYTGKDQAWAEWIAWQLEHAGYSTVIQAWDFKSGGVFPGDMHRALQQSTRVIAVLTPDYMGSKFCAPEWQAAFKRDPTGEKGILVCVRVTAFDPGGLLAGRTYIDLVGRAPDAARDFLLTRLKPGRAKPAIAPPHPGTAPAFPGAVPASADFVIPQNLPGGYIGRLFVGRDDFLVRLRETLLHQSAGHATAITQSAPAATSLNGLGGIGKTHTAVEYAAKYRGDYTALLFVHGDSPARLQTSLAFLCGVLHLNVDDGQPEPQRVAAAVDWLASHRGWLLIVDNVDDEAAVAALTRLLSHLTTGHVLITTRLQDWENNVEALDLDVLSPEAAADFLCAAADRRFGDRASDYPAARHLAEELECLPLAITQAAGYINQKRLTFEQALADYQREAPAILGWVSRMVTAGATPESLAPRAVLTTWKTSFDKLAPDTRRWLRVFAHYAPEHIPQILLESQPQTDAETQSRHRAALDALEEAEHYSLLTRMDGPPRFKLHRLVQQIIRRSATPEERATALTEGIQLIQESHPGDPTDVRTWPRWNPLTAHAQALATHAPDQPAPEGLSWLLNQLGVLLYTKALHTQAEPLYRRALGICESILGKEHPQVAAGLNNLAQLLQDTNRLAEAEPLMRRALGIDEASFGPEHPNVARDLNNLARLLKATNRLAEAEPLYRRALGIDEASFGPDHPDVAIDLNNLSALLQDTNRLAEAEPLMRRALGIWEISFGKEHPQVAAGLNNLALLLQATNRLAEAEPLMRRALGIDEASFGKDHPAVARDLNNLAQLLKATNRLAEAEPLMRRALGIWESSLGKEHPQVAAGLNNLAQLLQATNRLAEAEPLYRRALGIDEASFGKDHPNVARDLNNLAQLLKATNRLAEAEPLMRRALEIFSASYGPEHPSSQTVQRNLAALM